MGYAVYEDRDHDRWAGYGVPAECDGPGCKESIDRGLAFKCEDHGGYDEGGQWVEAQGCGLFFCGEHRYDTGAHDLMTGKPHTEEWVRHMLTDDSWAQWRTENPLRVAAMNATITAGPGGPGS